MSKKTSISYIFLFLGSLLIDEMSITEALSLNRDTMTYCGFVDLGKYTPKNLENVRADHALVFMFQPFRGSWVQVGFLFNKSYLR